MRISDWSSDVCSSDLLFLVGVDNEDDVGQAAHVLDAAQRQLELVALAGQLEDLLLGKAGGVARQLLLEALEALDRVGDRLPVGEQSGRASGRERGGQDV